MSQLQPKVLITGHRGFIGSALYKRFEGQADLVGVDIRDHNPIDIRDRDKLYEVSKEVDVIFHLAAISSLPACMEDTDAAYTTNIEGTKNVFEAALKNNCRVVFASSAAVYGDHDIPCAEYFATRSKGIYADSKLSGEIMAKEYMAKGVISTCLRFFNVYGEGSNPFYANAVKQFIYQAEEYNGLITIDGIGSQIRDFIYIDDAVEAAVYAYSRTYQPQWPIVMNVGTGQGTSITGLAKTIIGLTGSPNGIYYDTSRDGGIKISVADTALMKTVYPKTPRNIVQGLEEILSK